MELIIFVIIAVLLWFLFAIIKIAIRNPFIILTLIGLDFLFGDDDCDT